MNIKIKKSTPKYIFIVQTYCCTSFNVPKMGPAARANPNHYDKVGGMPEKQQK
jgi:hypothetical protein